LFGFEAVEGRRVEAAFDGGTMTSDAGVLLLGRADRRLGLLRRFAACFIDGRSSPDVEHTVERLVGQRVLGIALGYEDVNDHDELRHDPALAATLGRLAARRSRCAALAGKSTLNRLEHAPVDGGERYRKIGHDPGAIEALLVDVFLEAYDHPPEEIVLDLDATDDPIHGEQEGRFFHGYYGGYCYLPLYIFCGRHLLASKLRRSNIDGSAGALEEVERMVGQIRRRWPEVRIVLRADSGFARDALMAWCEQNRVDYLFGLARNARLVGEIEAELAEAAAESGRTGQPARRFKDFLWTTLDSWNCRRRVVAKAEHTQGEANPRFVVTSLGTHRADARALYEDLFCARGEMENRIKECQLDSHHACQPAPPVVRLDGLRAARRAAPHRAEGDQAGRCHLQLDPPQAPQDRRSRPHQRPARQDRHGVEPSPPARLGNRLCRPRRRALTRTRQRTVDITPQPTPPSAVTVSASA
jgi:hypothetical protein